jgi:RNA-directed DNA polymerase
VYPAVHGFVRGRSAVTHARTHVAAESVVCLDLRSFFASIGAARVNGLFRSLGYPEAVAWALACLCTHQTPVAVLAGMPAGGTASGRAWLRASLQTRHLPQGAPTSPALANLACFTLDRRLAGLAGAAGLTYSRYADDLTFSGPRGSAGRLVSAVGAIARDEGFDLNPSKTRVRTADERQEVTGLVVNDRVGVPREYHDQLRAVLHDAGRHGPTAANRLGHPDFRAHLEGRVGWVESVNPVRGRRLRAQLDAIVWPSPA